MATGGYVILYMVIGTTDSKRQGTPEQQGRGPVKATYLRLLEYDLSYDNTYSCRYMIFTGTTVAGLTYDLRVHLK